MAATPVEILHDIFRGTWMNQREAAEGIRDRRPRSPCLRDSSPSVLGGGVEADGFAARVVDEQVWPVPKEVGRHWLSQKFLRGAPMGTAGGDRRVLRPQE